MSLGPPVLCPPYYFLLLLSTPAPLPTLSLPLPTLSSTLPNDFLPENSSSSSETQVGESCEPELVAVTREDLLEEGYSQSKRAWTEEEDQRLLELCANRHLRFEDIAAQMQTRNAKMCYSRYRRLTNQSKDCWNSQENQRLLSCVQLYGEDWRGFAYLFPNRNHKQLKDHYDNYLRPNLCQEEWTLQDDLLLIQLLNTHGRNWKMIEGAMAGRSRNQLKNRYFGRIKRIHDRKNTPQGDKLGLRQM